MLNNKNITIVDLIRRKEEHYVFNSLTIKALTIISHIDNYWLAQDSKVIEDIEHKHKDKIKKIKVSNSKMYLWVISSLRLITVMLSVKIKKSEVLFLSLTPLQYWLVNFISKAIRVKTYVIMHGELGYLNHAEGRGQKLGAKFIDATLKSKSDVEFIAISSTIFDRISSKYPTRKFSYIEHPLQDFSGINKIKNDKLTFGSFGIQSKEKNSCQIYKLAELIENEFHSRLNLITVGVSNGTFDYDLSDNVKHFCKGHIKSSLIDKETFFENVSQIDVFLLFSQGGDKYDLVSSGVFADCIAMQKPIIGMRTPMLSRCFELYGEIGVLCDSLDDMKNAIYSICQDEELLKKYSYNLQEIKKDFSFDSYVKKLDEIMKK